jgi:hypothetical protein
VVLAGCAALAAGCAEDVSKQVVSDPATQTKVIEAIAGNPELAGLVLDRLLAGDTRAQVIEKAMGNGPAVQGILQKVATDQTMVDGVLGIAVQDSAMRGHVLAILKGMQMAGAK